MKKNEIFTFTAPNGVEVTAVVVGTTGVQEDYFGRQFLNHVCYAQNRLFTYYEWIDIEQKMYGEILVDYCILPDYDAMLERYSDSQVTSAEEQNNM
jgi:hypothetical protein